MERQFLMVAWIGKRGNEGKGENRTAVGEQLLGCGTEQKSVTN